MAAEHVERLRLPAGILQQRADFLDSYARFSLAELEQSSSSKESDRGTVPLGSDDAWIIAIDAATASLEAGQLTLPFDLDGARRRILQASDSYLAAGHQFGLFLKAISGDDQRRWQDLVRSAVDGLTGNRDRSEATEPNLHFRALPQQDAYGFVSASAMVSPSANSRSTETVGPSYDDSDSKFEPDDGMTRERQLLRSVASESAHRRGVIAVGSLGTPIHRFWACGRALLGVDEPSVLANHLVAMSATYTETIELAQANTYLWSHLASPVEIFDIDIFGIAVLATQRFGDGMVRNEILPRISPEATATIELAMEFQQFS